MERFSDILIMLKSLKYRIEHNSLAEVRYRPICDDEETRNQTARTFSNQVDEVRRRDVATF